jgi:hypothetical protein
MQKGNSPHPAMELKTQQAKITGREEWVFAQIAQQIPEILFLKLRLIEKG